MSDLAHAHVGVLSLEPWDQVHRRNQHLARRLVDHGWVREITFIGPPTGGFVPRAAEFSPQAGITAVTPPLLVPRRYGGHRLIGAWLRRRLRAVDVVWVNDPVAGAATLRLGKPILYDVTDDWRVLDQPAGDRRRTIAAEDLLASSALTIVCSDELARRWDDRYGTRPAVIRNGVDVRALRQESDLNLSGPAPHAVYVGTLHESRIDPTLLLELAERWPGRIHLVGPTELPSELVNSLAAQGVDFVGAVRSEDVPGWLNAADVLICPHRITEFTLSLDAIKSHEYLATDKPVVATASSGFQEIEAPGLRVTERDRFVDAALRAAQQPERFTRDVAIDWDQRAAQFADQLAATR